MFLLRGGFAWGAEDPGHAFNWHPLLMIIGMIYLYGNGKQIFFVGGGEINMGKHF